MIQVATSRRLFQEPAKCKRPVLRITIQNCAIINFYIRNDIKIPQSLYLQGIRVKRKNLGRVSTFLCCSSTTINFMM
jgi:hypothetical protein